MTANQFRSCDFMQKNITDCYSILLIIYCSLGNFTQLNGQLFNQNTFVQLAKILALIKYRECLIINILKL
jgi:hypothetical protein